MAAEALDDTLRPEQTVPTIQVGRTTLRVHLGPGVGPLALAPPETPRLRLVASPAIERAGDEESATDSGEAPIWPYEPPAEWPISEERAQEIELAEARARAAEALARPGWMHEHRRELLLGGLAVAAVVAEVALTQQAGISLEVIKQRILHNATWAGAGLVITESLYILGAAMAAAGAGMRIGNPFTLRQRWDEIRHAAARNPLYRLGIAINGIGALGSAAILGTAAVTTLPPQAWPLPLAVAGADMAQTVATRALLLPPRHNESQTATAERSRRPETVIRLATLDDIDALTDLDLRLFSGAYGETPPTHAEVSAMFTRRLQNNPHGMFVAVVNGEIRGFITTFRTSTPIEGFRSWEESTANGTLDGRVDPHGKYIYVANLTMDSHGIGHEALDSLIAYAFAKGIEDGVEYGYFCARMPGFRRWATAHAKELGVPLPEDGPALDEWATEYASLQRPDPKHPGRTIPRDRQLAFYKGMGLIQHGVVPHAFDDYDSMDYQVPFKAPVPLAWALRIKPARQLAAAGLRWLARHPKLLASARIF